MGTTVYRVIPGSNSSLGSSNITSNDEPLKRVTCRSRLDGIPPSVFAEAQKTDLLKDGVPFLISVLFLVFPTQNKTAALRNRMLKKSGFGNGRISWIRFIIRGNVSFRIYQRC